MKSSAGEHGDARRRPRITSQLLLATFITESARIGAYGDVVWAIDHYRTHYPYNIEVEVSTIVAYSALGDYIRARAAVRHAAQLTSLASLAGLAGRLLPRTKRISSDTQERFFKSLVVAVNANKRT